MITSFALAVVLGQTSPMSPQGSWLPDAEPAPQAVADQGRRSPAYIENRGQWSPEARYMGRFPGMDVWVTGSGFVYDFYRNEAQQPDPLTPHGDRTARVGPSEIIRSGQVVYAEFVGSVRPTASAADPVPGRVNFMSRSGSRSAGQFETVRLNGLYPGIDAVMYLDQGRPRYDLVLQPFADPSRIRMRYHGAESPQVDGAGRLRYRTRFGDVVEHDLKAFQGDRTVSVRARRLPSGEFGFSLGPYDPSKSLTIDPIVWAGFLGGDGSDIATAVASDASGNLYVTGATGSANFPTTIGAYDRNLLSATDVFVTKVDRSGSTLGYSTYIVGSGNQDRGNGIAVDSGGRAYVVGFTNSSDFPTTAGAFDETYNGQGDAFALRLSADGSVLQWSTFLGGSQEPGGSGEDTANGVALLSGNRVAVVGATGSTNFPTTVGAFDITYNGGTDAFVSVLASDGASLEWSTYLGGPQFDAAYGVSRSNDGLVLLAGGTYSTDFPTTPGTLRNHHGAEDAFVTLFSESGSALNYSTFYGGAGVDYGVGAQQRPSDLVSLAGTTTTSNLPGRGNRFDPVFGPPADGFVATIGLTGNVVRQTTYVGGTGLDVLAGLATDGSGRPIVVGTTYCLDFPTTPNSGSGAGSAAGNAFVASFDGTLRNLVYGGVYGGATNSGLLGVTADPNGNALAVGIADSGAFPTGAGISRLDTYNVPPDFGMTDAFAGLGDVNGDGQPDLILYDASTGQVFARLINGQSTLGTMPMQGELIAEEIVVGHRDVDGNGSTDILIQNTTTGALSIWFYDGPTRIDVRSVSDDLPAGKTVRGLGSFDFSNRTSIVVQDDATRALEAWVLDDNLDVVDTLAFSDVPPANLTPVVMPSLLGRTGNSDLVFVATNRWVWLWRMSGTDRVSAQQLSVRVPTGGKLLGLADMTNDGQQDMVVMANARPQVWVMDWGPYARQALPGSHSTGVVARISIPIRSDVVINDPATGEYRVWRLDNNTLGLRTNLLPAGTLPGFSLFGVRDFNSDGSADLLFHDVDRNLRIGLGIGDVVQRFVAPTVDQIAVFAVQTAGDVDDSGSPSIVYQRTTNGQIRYARFTDTAYRSSVNYPINPGVQWRAVGVADFNGDGLNEILLYNATLRQFRAISPSAGTLSFAEAVPGTEEFVDVGDFNGDGKPDLLLWDAADRRLILWIMNGTTRESRLQVGTRLPAGWVPRRVGDF